jgi:hypothetical protein
MSQLFSALTHLVGSGEDAIHRANRAEISPFIQEGGIYFCGSLIDEAVAMKNVQHVLSLVAT